jgi:nucleoside-diphosphate-sugar epimerase
LKHVFVTGGTGYMGRRLIPLLQRRGHAITAVVREESQWKLPAGCETIVADVLDRTTWERHLRPSHTLVHLVGVAHPSPSKALEFVDIDLRSAREAIAAARKARVEQFVYVSVAQPAPAMKSYVIVRAACESAIREARLNATVLRPWYVLGPGHWWPLALVPFYKLAEIVPWTAEGARRLGLVNLDQMTAALTHAVENPAAGTKVVEVPAILAIARQFASGDGPRSIPRIDRKE